MNLRTRLLGAGSALLLTAGAAAAAPATVSTDLNMRSGPGTSYAVIDTIPGGATVDVESCTGSWCMVNYAGRSGYASASYLSGGASVGGGAVAVAPGYVEEPYYDDYYDYGYSYGPSIGIYAGPRYRYGWRGHWRGRHHGGWAGRPGWHGPRHGNWQGRRGGDRVGSVTRPAAPRAAPGSVAPRVTAPAGMPRGNVTSPGTSRGGALLSGAPRGGGAAPAGGGGTARGGLLSR